MKKKLVHGCLLTVGLFAAVSILSAAFGTVVGLYHAITATGGESIDPGQKARILAEGISEAMNCTAFAFIVLVPIAVGVGVWWWRHRRKGNGDDGNGPDVPSERCLTENPLVGCVGTTQPPCRLPSSDTDPGIIGK